MGMVSNPILPGFHPDPSILRVGDWYYLANSTFEWFPGVEIHRSRDLANWERLPSALQRKSQLDMVGNPPSGGIWAPCLSWADGLFWLIYTDVKHWSPGPCKDTPNYLVTAESAEGPWSEPVFLNATGFDPSLFHDEDGRKWLVNMEWDYRKKEGTGRFTGILLQEYDPLKKSLVGSVRNVYRGTSLGKTEGPHLYRRDGFYYLVVAEGGTQYDHAVSVARSKSLLGPYETHPENPLVTSRGGKDLYLKKAGHGSWCDTPDGRTFAAFLVGRPLPGTDRCVLGRETALAELVWRDGWPRLKDGGNAPPAAFDAPGERKFAAPALDYDFGSETFRNDFKTLRVPFEETRFSLTAPARLPSDPGRGEPPVQASAVRRRPQADRFFLRRRDLRGLRARHLPQDGRAHLSVRRAEPVLPPGLPRREAREVPRPPRVRTGELPPAPGRG